MLNTKFKKIAVIASVLFLQPILSPGSFAFAKKKKTPPKAYTFIVEGGKASQGECDGERKIPRKLKHQKEFAKSSSYMGSELQVPEVNAKASGEMWKHFFRDKSLCNSALAKAPSSLDNATKNSKVEIPSEDSVDDDNDTDKSDSPE